MYERKEITLIGTGGLEGDAGHYETHGLTDTALRFIVPEDVNAYEVRNAKTNEDVTYELGYKGAKYAEYDFHSQYDVDISPSYKYSKVTMSRESRLGGEMYNWGVGYDKGEQVPYSANNMYKAFIGMAHGFMDNFDESPEFYTSYVNKLYHYVANRIEYNKNLFLTTDFVEDQHQLLEFTFTDLDDPDLREQHVIALGNKAEVLLFMQYTDAGIQDILRLDDTDNAWAHANGSIGAYGPQEGEENYLIWGGFTKANGVETGWWKANGTASDAHRIALDNYEYADVDWEEGFDKIVFPDAWASTLTDAEIINILEQILVNLGAEGLSPEREAFMQFALSCVGEFYYKYGGGHGNLDDPGAGLDCSGFISYVLYQNGLLTTDGTGLSCTGLLSSYKYSSFNGDFSSLKPGTIIVKDNTAGGSASSSNHTVIYLGKIQLEGDAAPRDYCVECTTTKTGGSGVQLSSPQRMETISKYNYIIDPFAQ